MGVPRKEIVYRKKFEKLKISMGVYTTALSPTEFSCKKCTHTWLGKPEYTHSCPGCRTSGRAFSMSEWQERTKTFKLLSKKGAYFNTQCNTCGTFALKHRSTIGKNECKACTSSAHSFKVTTPFENVVARLRTVLPSVKIKRTSYVGMAKPALFLCTSCDKRFESSPHALFRRPQCPLCVTRRYVYKGMIMEGYEASAYEWLIQNGFDKRYLHASLDGNVPRIEVYSESRYFHKPDFYYSKTNTLIECKSIWTLTMNEQALSRVVNNVKAALDMGYEYKMLVFKDELTYVELPHRWERQNHLVLRKYLNKSAPRQTLKGLSDKSKLPGHCA